MSAIAVSMCMIARDSARTIRPALESIRPWVDEMIVVDTGSTDDTAAIASQCGARVGHFPWCDDFAAARNESMRLAQGRWLFWMDSDDTIDADSGRRLRSLIDQPHPPAVMGFVAQVHCPGEDDHGDYRTQTIVDHVKIVRNIPAIRFTGRIHEQVLPSIRALGGDILRTDVFVCHSGADLSPQGRARKQARDLRILALELRDHPDSTFALFNLGMTLIDTSQYEASLGPLCRSLQLSSPGESHLRKLYALLTQAYARLGRTATALRTCVQGLALFPDDPELLFRRGVLEQLSGRLDLAEHAFKQVLSLPTPKHFASVDHGIFNVKAWHNLGLLYERQRRPRDAANAWRRILDQTPDSRPAWLGLINALAADRDAQALQRALDHLRSRSPLADLHTIGAAHLELLHGQPDRCAATLRQALSLRPHSLDLLEAACQITFETGLLHDAIEFLETLTRRKPDDPAAFQNLAVVYCRLDRPVHAIPAITRALELRPNFPASQAVLQHARRLAGVPAPDATPEQEPPSHNLAGTVV